MKIPKTRACILAFLGGFIISNIALAADGNSAAPATDVYRLDQLDMRLPQK
jgi:hypothetical protein